MYVFMYFNYAINIIPVLFFCGIIIHINLFFQGKYAQYMLGIIFGLITLFVMKNNVLLGTGYLFDFRHITMTMAGFIGGPVSAALAAIISSIYRYNLGGSGLIEGIIDILIFGCFGIILGNFAGKVQNGKKFLFWYIIGLVMSVILIFIIAFIPPGKSNTALILNRVAGPFLLITPLATTAIFNFYYWAYCQDITSRKTAEEEIARLDRLNLVGQMAAGIGHEIRNPLTIVRGYLQILGAKPQNEAQKSIFNIMISELDRANFIISEFLSLVKTNKTEVQLQNLNDILDQLYPLLEADTFTQNKQIEYIPGNIPDLEINKKEISQLVLNLTRNGLEAMKTRGRLTIKTYVENDKVTLAIEDEGCGISVKDLEKLGTPFFTTKENGTGLGLATSYKIAQSHNAKIEIDTGPKGTKFLISFPIPFRVYGQNLQHS